MVEVVLTGLGKIADYLVAPIGRQFTYLFCFNSNIKELEAKFEGFQATRQGVQMGVDRDERNVRVIAPNVEAWLKSASEVTTEVEGIIQDKAKVKEGCLNGWCPNLKLRYSLSRKAVKKTTVVVDLRKDGVQYTQLSYSPPPIFLETITNRDFTGFESRRLHMEEIFKALKRDEINLIGVCGMGGVGKTTMVNEVAKSAKEDNHFDEVAMAIVGQEPNLDNVQACIADMLGLKKFRNTKSPIERADLLRRRLLQDNKKILVILDNVWEEMNLEDMGFPLRGANKNFKMLYTSRVRDLWHHVRTKKEIPLELLSEDEAWQLLREKAGDSADARDLQPIAKQIVHECGRLPLALVLIGSALSRKCGRNAIKDIWEEMLDRLTCASSTPAEDQLFSRLQLSYEYLDEEARRLFLLCCFFQEDENIRIEDLARYGYGLSLFDGINEMANVRIRVFLIVDDLKSRYLLLQSFEEECVKVHDVVRDMGICIASKDKYARVTHGAISQWPMTVTHEHYTAISVISEKIKELPEGLAYPNLEFLMLRCHKLEKLPPNFFEGIGKLKVLELKNFHGILTFQPLKNLTTLALEGFCGELDNVRVIGDLLNLEILNFRDSDIEELPEEIGGLVNLRLLDLSDTDSLNRIPPGVISRLGRLEELYCMDSEFSGWEGEGKEQGGRNANLREFESLSNLNTLQIQIRNDVLIPESPIFSKLKNYRVAIVDKDDDIGFGMDDIDFGTDDVDVLVKGLKRILEGYASIPMIDLFARISDGLVLWGWEGCNDLSREVLFRDGVDGIQQLKVLAVCEYNNLKCLADTMNRVHIPTAILRSEEKKPAATAPPTSAFPILQILYLNKLPDLREICRGPVPAGSFGELTFISVEKCGRLGNLFQLPVVGCLTQLKRLSIKSNDMMEEVFQKEQQGDVRDITNRIVFPKLEFLELEELPSLVGFCRGIDLIDFPQLKELCLRDMPQFNLLFHTNSNLSSNSEQGFLSLFPHKVAIPSLEYLQLSGLKNVRNMFHPSMAVALVNLQKLLIEDCSTLEVVVGKEEEVGGHGRKLDKTLFPQLIKLQLSRLPKLKRFCHFTHPLELPRLSKMDILFCPSMDAFSLGHVSAPNLSLLGISWNGDLNNAIQSFQKLSYEDLEDEAKRLFLLCCFFQEDEDIRIEDLARYGYGLSLFDQINDMAEVRRRVLLIVDDLKSCYLLLQSSNEKCVKVHDVARDIFISIASNDKCAIVSHGAVSEWPKTVTDENEHYTAISVISEKIKELPEGLAYPNLEFLMLQCHKLEKLPPNFFEGIGKLKVLELTNFHGILTFQPLKNLTTLALKGFCGELDNVRVIGDLLNLEILNFRDSDIEELPEEIGRLVNLRLLDLSDIDSLNRIPPGVISRLGRLEELYCMDSEFSGWEGEGKEQGGRNANLREFESLSNLNTLQIQIRNDVLIPESPIFSKLKNYRVAIVDKDDDIGFGMDDIGFGTDDVDVLVKGLKRILEGYASIPMIDLFARSSDGLVLWGWEGCNDLLREVLFRDGVDGIQQLKFLVVCEYDNLKCLADTMNLVHLPSAILRSEEKKPTASAPPTAAFPILQILYLTELPNLREICRGPVPTGSFGELTSIRVEKCGRLGNLFPLPVEGCLTQLKHLSIKSNYMMEEVFRKEQQGDVRDITNRIVFPKLESLELVKLPSLVVFCRGIDLIDFPQLKELRLRDMPQFNLFHSNSNLSSHSEQGFLSVFPHKVTFPRLENLELDGCESLRYIFQPSMARELANLQELIINDCSKMEAVVDGEEEREDGQGTKSTDKTLFPHLIKLKLRRLPELRRFCHFMYPLELPLLSQMVIEVCPRLKSFSSGSMRSSAHAQMVLFNDKVKFPRLENLELEGCESLKYVFQPSMARDLVNLQELVINDCSKMEAVVDREEEIEGGQGRKSADKTLFPRLSKLELRRLQQLKRFCHFKYPLELPLLSQMVIWDCPSMDSFSFGYVRAPNLRLQATSRNGKIWR